MPREFDADEWERIEMVTERVERIRDYVPAEEFDETTAQMIARTEIGGNYQTGQ